MILSDSTILKELEEIGGVYISPFDKSRLGPNSVDLTLNENFRVYANGILDVKKDNPTIRGVFPEEGFILQPNELYLGMTNEIVGCHGNVCANVEGKSSLGRLGIKAHITAGFVDTGFQGNIVLEIEVFKPVRIYPNMPICQIKFQRVEGVVLESYDKKKNSKYNNQSEVLPSRMHLNFK
jgi:dCTP deaminase